MCDYQTLCYNNTSGYIISCNQCKTIQLAFGNVSISFFKSDFYGFQKWIERIWENTSTANASLLRNIEVPLPSDGVRLILNHTELNQLYQMLNSAVIEMQSLELISLFEKN